MCACAVLGGGLTRHERGRGELECQEVGFVGRTWNKVTELQEDD
jgi:hypothetical protein